jgi:hypothetical protein
MAEESDLERTEPASARRLEQAREEGQVPRSREIGAFLILIVAAAAFWLMGPWMVQRVAEIFRRGLVARPDLAREPTLMLVRLADISLTPCSLSPLCLRAGRCRAAVAVFSRQLEFFAQGAAARRLSRLNPLKGWPAWFPGTAWWNWSRRWPRRRCSAALPSGSCGASAATCWRCLRNRAGRPGERRSSAQLQFPGHRFGDVADRCRRCALSRSGNTTTSSR